MRLLAVIAALVVLAAQSLGQTVVDGEPIGAVSEDDVHVIVDPLLDEKVDVATTITINGVSYDLRSNRVWVVSSGSGFPLTNDVSAASFDIRDVGMLEANEADFSGDVVIRGGLSVISGATNFEWVTISYATNVYVGISTTFLATVVYATQNVAIVTNIVETRTLTVTQTVNKVVNIGGYIDAMLADWSGFPQLLLSNGVATATGTWDFTQATILPAPVYLIPYEVSVANSSVELVATNVGYRVFVTGSGSITNFGLSGATTGTLGRVQVQLEPGPATDFSWGLSVKTNVPFPEPYSTNMFFFWSPVGVTNWFVD